MTSARAGKGKKRTAAHSASSRDARQAAATQAKARNRRNVKSKIAELTMEVDGQLAELQAVRRQIVPLPHLPPAKEAVNAAAVGDLAEILRGL